MVEAWLRQNDRWWFDIGDLTNRYFTRVAQCLRVPRGLADGAGTGSQQACITFELPSSDYLAYKALVDGLTLMLHKKYSISSIVRAQIAFAVTTVRDNPVTLLRSSCLLADGLGGVGGVAIDHLILQRRPFQNPRLGGAPHAHASDRLEQEAACLRLRAPRPGKGHQAAQCGHHPAAIDCRGGQPCRPPGSGDDLQHGCAQSRCGVREDAAQLQLRVVRAPEALAGFVSTPTCVPPLLPIPHTALSPWPK